MPPDLIVWLVICAAWLGFEAFSLYRQDDEVKPFTYWVREALALRRGPFSLGWWLGAGLIAWVAWHFLVEDVFL